MSAGPTNWPEKAAENGLSTWIPQPGGRPGCGSWLQPDPPVAVAATWGIKQQMEDLSPSVSFPPFVTLPFK